jgi:hypothetical protein
LNVVFDSKVVVRPTRVVASCEEDATVRLVLTDDMRTSGSRKDTILADDKLLHAIGRADLEDRLHGLLHIVSAITPDDKGVRYGVKRIEDSLDEVLRVVLV